MAITGTLTPGILHRGWASWLGTLLTPGCIAVFLAWFGGVGYLLTRHSALGLGADLAIAVLVGLAGAFLLGAFLRWLLSHEQPLETTDTEIVGMLGESRAQSVQAALEK
jgi:hypothetical protein